VETDHVATSPAERVGTRVVAVTPVDDLALDRVTRPTGAARVPPRALVRAVPPAQQVAADGRVRLGARPPVAAG